jgi:hypothetical protein
MPPTFTDSTLGCLLPLSTRVRNYSDVCAERGGLGCWSEAAGDAVNAASHSVSIGLSADWSRSPNGWFLHKDARKNVPIIPVMDNIYYTVFRILHKVKSLGSLPNLISSSLFIFYYIM